MEAVGTKPNEIQIRQTIAFVKKRLANPDIDLPRNRPQQEGYTEVLDILQQGRETYDGIVALRTQQGRAIAVLAVDYLLGDCTQEVLIKVPLKLGSAR